jgi:cobalt/nickel transport system permease protein
MPGSVFFPLLAVHISDGVLAPGWVAGGFVLTALLALLGAWRIRDEEIPRVALLTAAFFVASLIHVPVGPTSVHLLLTGLVGVVLGRRAALAVPVGLFLQAVLLHHGGYTSLGVNSCIMVLPALLAWWLFGLVRPLPWGRRAWFRSGLVAASALVWGLSVVFSVALLVTNWDAGPGRLDFGPAAQAALHPLALAAGLAAALLVAWAERRLGNAPEFAVGLLVGEVAVLATALLNFVALGWGAEANYQTVALAVLVAHLPLAVVEGLVLGSTVGFLARVRPDLLGRPAAPAAAPEAPPEGRAKVPVKALGCLLAVAGGLLVPARAARAHALEADWDPLPGHKVRITSWYSARPRSFPAQGARVRVFGPENHRPVAEGQTDDKGVFVFHYEKQEPLTVEVYQEGHLKTLRLFEGGTAGTVADSPGQDGAGPAGRQTVPPTLPAGRHEESVLRDVLIGVGFLLALAAFVLSVRNGRRLRALARGPGRPHAE